MRCKWRALPAVCAVRGACVAAASRRVYRAAGQCTARRARRFWLPPQTAAPAPYRQRRGDDWALRRRAVAPPLAAARPFIHSRSTSNRPRDRPVLDIAAAAALLTPPFAYGPAPPFPNKTSAVNDMPQPRRAPASPVVARRSAAAHMHTNHSAADALAGAPRGDRRGGPAACGHTATAPAAACRATAAISPAARRQPRQQGKRRRRRFVARRARADDLSRAVLLYR